MPAGGIVIMAVYVDDIILTRSDDQGILEAQTFLHSHFVCRDMGRPRYFIGIEFAYRSQEISLSQRKYVLDLLQETGQLGCKPERTPVELTPHTEIHHLQSLMIQLHTDVLWKNSFISQLLVRTSHLQ